MERLTFNLPELEPGWVWLTGAGPGDPGLLTLHALNGIRQADVIVHDALVSDETLSLAGPDCEIVYAGKRGGRPSPKQPDISARLVKLARAGKRVLRLKGGDPFIFGRGGEEALALVAAGVPFRVVPGISAGVGGLAHAGIPLTHRETNSAVTFVTGHGASGDIPDGIDWPALAAGSPVLVIYMAIKHLGTIRERLTEGGRRADEPVAVVSRASQPDERVLVTTLGACVEDVASQEIEPPAMVVIGEVVRLRAGLDWAGALGGKILDADPLGTRSTRDAG
jgi:uroporphyrin-III C-methyltransferase